MSIKLSHPTKQIKGRINLTASKSESNRVLIIQALSASSFKIKNLAEAKDTTTLKELLELNNRELDVGHAGTVMRFLTAYLCLKKGEYILTGSNRMKQRPIGILVEALRILGAKIEYLEHEGFPPLKITGNEMQGGTIDIDGSVSSQYISALLLIAPKLQNGLTLRFKGEVTSKPYINMTIKLMEYYDIPVNWVGNTIVVNSGEYKARNVTIEGDWSAASYWYGIVANSKNGEVEISGLKKQSLQGDAIVSTIYEGLGVKTEFIENGVRLVKKPTVQRPLSHLEMNFEDCPDIAQTVAVTCASLKNSVKLTGLKTLRIKETDRIFALKTELNKQGFNVDVKGDDLIITPLGEGQSSSVYNTGKITQKEVKKTLIKTYDDHRMAMAFAPLALLNNIEIEIEDEGVVVKSYPNFWEDLKKVGFRIN